MKKPKKYTVSKTITLKELVRAYELWTSTDLTLNEISKALNLNNRNLIYAINRAEKRGIYDYYIPRSSTKIVVKCIEISKGLTTEQIAKLTNLKLYIAKQATYRAHRQGLIKRRKSKDKSQSKSLTYIYYIN